MAALARRVLLCAPTPAKGAYHLTVHPRAATVVRIRLRRTTAPFSCCYRHNNIHLPLRATHPPQLQIRTVLRLSTTTAISFHVAVVRISFNYHSVLRVCAAFHPAHGAARFTTRTNRHGRLPCDVPAGRYYRCLLPTPCFAATARAPTPIPRTFRIPILPPSDTSVRALRPRQHAALFFHTGTI